MAQVFEFREVVCSSMTRCAYCALVCCSVLVPQAALSRASGFVNFQDEEPENLKIHRRASGCAAPAFLLTLLQAQGRGCNRGGEFGRIAVAGIARPLALVARN